MQHQFVLWMKACVVCAVLLPVCAGARGFRRSSVPRLTRRRAFSAPSAYKESENPIIKKVVKVMEEPKGSFVSKKVEKLTALQSKRYWKKDFSSLGVKYLDSLTAGTLDVFDDDVQISLSKEERDRQKDLVDRFGKKIASNYVGQVHIGWVNSLVGYGVFASNNVKQGEFLGECTGQITPISKVSHRNDCLFYYPSSSPKKQFVVDTSHEGNYFRFLNHDKTANINAEYVYYKGLWHHVFLAAKDIEPGDQLLINYGPEFWHGRKQPLPLS